ncbi:hypothetical protein [Paraburkholderia lacunae]|uniref:hypothetical protein n=1 Tax=Paraburkholderia lacunae TaxID=2211104 RepID=UPI001058A267|nr:hypothetical protein [Paraburkholderia lacunae]
MGDKSAASVGTTVSDMGWRQGAIAHPDCHGFFHDQLRACGRDDLADVLVAEQMCVIAVSQTCDIVQFRDDAEPYVEFLLARIADGPPNAADTNLKSFRTFAAPLESVDRHVSVKPWNRFLVRRELVAQISPSTELTLATTRVRDLLDWLMTRYVRAALPDEFNRRLGTMKAEDKIRKLLAQLPAVTEVFIALRPRHDELPADQPYTCDVSLLCREAAFSDAPLREKMQPLLDEFEALLEGIDGIETEAVRLLGEHQFSRHHMRVYHRWQFDDVSYAADTRADKQGLAGSGHEYRQELGRSNPTTLIFQPGPARNALNLSLRIATPRTASMALI